MKDTKLILTPFRDAVLTLEEVLLKQPTDDVVRDASIKRFEYSFELAWKLMKRVLEVDYNQAETDMLTKKDLFRQAHEIGLITDPQAWFKYLDARNRTAHEYSETAANAVYASAKRFLPDAKKLLVELEKRYA
jgi:nucleotidyltransferase substrate binding protein (TIGR01987 family)